MPFKRCLFSIDGHYTKQGLTKILGIPTWSWEVKEIESTGDSTCSYSIIGEVERIKTAGWGDAEACCRIWIHKKGICIAGGMSIIEDEQLAESTYNKLLKLRNSSKKRIR